MERIELFDSYINNQLSDAQRTEFDAQLKSDEAFASEFKVYLLTVNGLCREARQENLDFGMAMKRLSKAQLREIVGQGNTTTPEIAETKKPKKVLKYRPWIWQVASIAAVLVIAMTAVYNIEKSARYSVDNAIYACADINTDLTRDGSEFLDLRSMTDDELREKLPQLVESYNSAKSSDDIADNGYALAMAYLRLHDRDNAKIVLTALVHQFENNPDYAEYVSKWQSILKILK